MFCSKFFNSSWQPFKNNPWPTHPMNQNCRKWFHRQCDYLFKFQAERKTSKLILFWKWLNNASNVENNAYETPILAYNKELDLRVSASSITISDVEEESSPPYPKNAMMDSKEKTTNSKNTTLMATPQSTMGSNKLNNPPMAPSFAQYVQNRVWWRI
jgi:hypothetical protein